MKKNSFLLLLLLLILYILIFPQEAFRAASHGLVLWYSGLLPTLLPFAILSSLIISTGILQSFTGFLHRFAKHVIPVSAAGIYPLLAGFLFGFPLGSSITAQLVEQKQLDYEEGCRLYSVCSNISPVFIRGYILTTTLNRPDLTAVTIAILYLPPFLYFCIEAGVLAAKGRPPSHIKNVASRSQIDFKIIDASIMNGFETLTKLGGYIIMFAILSQTAAHLPMVTPLPNCILTGFIEITNGISCISSAPLSFQTKYVLIVVSTAFGGLSGLAQTASMVKTAGFPILKYVKTKAVCSLISAILALLVIKYLS